MKITEKKPFADGEYTKVVFAPCELTFLQLKSDIITTSGEDPFGTKDEDFEIFDLNGNMTGGNE